MGKTAPSAKPTCVCYVRTSTSSQRERETIGAQVERCTRLVQMHGLQLLKYGVKGSTRQDGWVTDDGTTGTLLDGRNFALLLDDLEAKKLKPTYIVVFSISRISRVDKVSKDIDKLKASHAAAARISAVLIGTGVQLLDEEGPCDPSSLSFQLKSMLANEEFKAIRARTMSGKARWLREGRLAQGGRPPYGYRHVFANDVDGKEGYKRVPHEENAKRVRKVLGWFCDGGYSYAARKANEAGWPPSSATTRRKQKAEGWNDSVRYIVLAARKYLGEQTFEFDGDTYTVKYAPLIDAEFYARICRAQKEFTISKRTDFLSTGFVDCACGKHAFAHSTRGRHMVTCRNYCGRLPEKTFAAVLWDATVTRLVQIKEQDQELPAAGRNGRAMRVAKTELVEVQGQIGKLADLYLSGMSKTVWREKNDALNDRLALAQAEVDRLTREQAEAAQKRTMEASVHERVAALLAELDVERDMLPLERKREVLGDVLAGSRALVAWKDDGATITLPAWGTLPALTMKVDPDLGWIRHRA